MKLLQFVMDMGFELNGCRDYGAICSDGCKIYLSEPRCRKIHIYNMNMEHLDCIAVCRGYKELCYDSGSNCFWGYSEQFNERIIKLNKCFEEIGHISINRDNKICGDIVGISANCCDCSLLLAYRDGIAEVSKETGVVSRVINKNKCRRYSAVGGECEYYAYAYEKTGTQYLAVSGIDDREILRCCIEEGYWVDDIAVFENLIYLLIRGCGRVYVAVLCLSEVETCRPCPTPHPCPPTPPCPYPPTPCPCPPTPPCPCPPVPPCPPSGCWDELCAVIHSIALGEAALSHILNAEGEKIQKGVQIGQSVEELLKLNESVRCTIDKVAKLEYVLYSKLETVKDMCPKIFSQCCSDECMGNPFEEIGIADISSIWLDIERILGNEDEMLEE